MGSRDRLKKLSIAYECAKAIGKSLDLREMLGEVINTIVDKTKAYYGIVWFKEKDKIFNPFVGAKVELGDKGTMEKITSVCDGLIKASKAKKFILKCRINKDFLKYCPDLTGKEESVLLIPVSKVALIHLIYASSDDIDKSLADLLSGLSKNIYHAIENCIQAKGVFGDSLVTKEVKRKLLVAKEEYLSLFDRIDRHIHIANNDLRIVYINKPFKRWLSKLGFESKNLIGRHLFDVFPFLPESIREEYNQVFREGELLVTEETHEIGGEKIVAETRKIPVMHKNNVIGVVTIVVDITERKTKEKELKELYRESEESRKALLSILEDTTETEAALRKSEERFRDIVKNTGNWIWEVNEKGQYTYSNDAIEKILGYKPEEVLGRFFYDFFHQDERDILKKKALEIFDKRDPFRGFINRNIHRDGHTVILETSGVAVKASDGRLIGYRGLDWDITEKKQMEDALKESLQQTEFLLDLMSHDLNNINQAISSSLELMLTSEPFNLKYPRLALAEVHRSRALVSNVKKFMLLREKEYKEEKVSLTPALKSAISQLCKDFPRKDVTVHFKTQRGPKFVKADGLLYDLFYNILNNAARFDRHKKVVLDILLFSDNGFWRFDFKDRGPGIIDERKQEVFFRTKVRKDGLRGSGLGLTLVKGLVDRYGGKIWIEDRVKERPEDGSNFIVLLPKYSST